LAKLTNIQLFCILFVTMAVTPYQVLAKLLAANVAQHGWVVIIGSIAPGLLLVWIYYYILVNSRRTFPGMLEEHLGTLIGKTLGFVYIWVFFLVVVMSLVIFANFFLSNVLPGFLCPAQWLGDYRPGYRDNYNDRLPVSYGFVVFGPGTGN